MTIPNSAVQANFSTNVFTSKTVFTYDSASNRWVKTSAEPSVAEKYNDWADRENMNPVYAPTTTTSVIRDSETRVTWLQTLTAVSVSRKEQVQLELFYREHMSRVMAAIGGVKLGHEARPVASQRPAPVVDVSSLGETPPAYPGASDRVHFPVFDEPSL